VGSSRARFFFGWSADDVVGSFAADYTNHAAYMTTHSTLSNVKQVKLLFLNGVSEKSTTTKTAISQLAH